MIYYYLSLLSKKDRDHMLEDLNEGNIEFETEIKSSIS